MNRRIRRLGLAATTITLLLSTAPGATAVTATGLSPATHHVATSRRWLPPTTHWYRVSLRYGVRGSWIAGHHTGVDLAVPSGTPVYSVGPGTVVSAGRAGDYGKAVKIRMRDGYYALFAHLSHISVHRGERVTAYTRLGYSGATGRATGPHLHFEVRDGRGYGTDVSPVRYLDRHGVRLAR